MARREVPDCKTVVRNSLGLNIARGWGRGSTSTRKRKNQSLQCICIYSIRKILLRMGFSLFLFSAIIVFATDSMRKMFILFLIFDF